MCVTSVNPLTYAHRFIGYQFDMWTRTEPFLAMLFEGSKFLKGLDLACVQGVDN